jgi:hypothetical protein
MERKTPGALVARCIVCRGNIHDGENYEMWEGGYYCERHSLPWLRERARLYAALLRGEEELASQDER